MPGAITWCSICNSRPADGVLELLDKYTYEVVPYDACNDCVVKVRAGQVDWIQNGLPS